MKKILLSILIMSFLAQGSCYALGNKNKGVNNMGVNNMNSGKIVQTAGRDNLGNFAPEFAHFNDDILFGENWNNKDIPIKTRCIITIVALMSQGITDSSMKHHLQNAKNNGVTKEEIAAVITHTAFYAGWPKAWATFNLAKEVWNEPTQALTEKRKICSNHNVPDWATK